MTDKNRFRVFATSRIGDPAESRLRERGYDLEVFQGPEAPPKKLVVEKVKSGIDGLITTLRDPIDAEIFEAGKGTLKVVAQIAVGGTGRIGLAMIKKCSGFDMNMLCYDPAYHNDKYIASIQELMDLRHASAIQKEKTYIKYDEFEEALRGADYVSIHVPLLRESETDKPTFHLINEKTLKLMKPTAYLINTSRGPVVNEKALAKALKDKVIAGAALDVFEKEPSPPDSPLLDPEIADRTRLFHHFTSGAQITRLSVDPDKGMAGRTVQGLIDVLEGNYGGDPTKMPYVVNKEAFGKKVES